jgi:glycosyltransferase involved in cell wall biosynthesis
VRILLLAPQPFYSNRGTPIAVKLICEGLSKLGHTVDVLTYFEGEPVHIPRVTLYRIRRPPLVHHVPIGPSWQKLLCDVVMIREVKRMIAGKNYDLIHGVEEGAVMAARTGLPFVFDMDSAMSRQIIEKSPLLWPVAKLVEYLERDAMRRSEGVLAVCQALVEEAKKHQSNVHLLPDLPMDGQEPGELPREITDRAGTHLMYVGNLQPYQGVALMLEAFAVAAASRSEATLVVVGGDAHGIETYRKRAVELGIANRVRFAGPVPVERLGRVLELADVLISPRLKGENTPMKLYSYLLSGRPVLATRLPTHTQVVSDAEALLVEPTVSGMATGMIRLLESSELRERIGDAGRELARREYSRSAFDRRLRAFYEATRSPRSFSSARPRASSLPTKSAPRTTS